MLFASMGTLRANCTEEGEREVLRRFSTWAPAAGAELKALYVTADGRSNIGIFEATSAAALLESLLPFAPFFDVEVKPIMDASESTPLYRRARGLD